MIDQSIQQKIKKIKIHTKRVMQSTLVGDYLSAFKGSGLEFDQIREYHMGDDIRSIDWNSSAKMNKMMVKQFVEERDRTVILVIDVSASNNFSSQLDLRKEKIAQLAGTLAFIASENKDKVGALFFSDTIEHWIAPSKGNNHLGSILEKIFTLKPKSQKTDLAMVLKFLVGLKKRNAVVFMISDWIDDSSDYNKFLKIAGCEYDFVGIRVIDPIEQQLPEIGLFDIQDSESGQIYALNTQGSKQQASPLTHFLRARLLEQKKRFEKYNIDLLDLMTNRPFITPLIQFFSKRIKTRV